MSKLPRTYALLAALIVGLAGCDFDSAQAGAPAATRIDTINGVEHVTFAGEGGWRAEAAWRVDTARIVHIGRFDGADAYLFGQIVGAVVGADGRIYVADDQAKEVRIFTPEGEFVSRFGRDGEGPGEFRTISGLGRGPDDGIALVDGGLSRISLFGPDGRFRRSFRLERPARVIGQSDVVRFDELGRYYDQRRLSPRAGADSIGAVRYSPAGVVEDTVLLWTHEPAQLVIMEGDRPMANISIPFAPHPSAAIDSRGRAYTTSGGPYRIALLDPSGDTLRVLQRQVEPVPVDAARRDAARDSLVELYARIAGAEPRDPPEIPEQMPAILALQVDEEDCLWVLRPTSDASMMAWDVFDQEGSFMGELRIPAMRVMHIGERTIAGVVHDEMGVPKVRVLPLSRE